MDFSLRTARHALPALQWLLGLAGRSQRFCFTLISVTAFGKGLSVPLPSGPPPQANPDGAWASSAYSTSGQASLGKRSIAARPTEYLSLRPILPLPECMNTTDISSPIEREALPDGGPMLPSLALVARFLSDACLQDGDDRLVGKRSCPSVSNARASGATEPM